MTVLCANCHTANRDRAMFCIGCAAKLPAFAATGPSALQTLDAASAGKKARASHAPDEPMAARPLVAPTLAQRGLLLAVLLLGATVLALAAWISFGPERSEAPGMASAAASLTPLPVTPVATPAPARQVPVEAALVPGESTVPPPSAAPSPQTPAAAPSMASTPAFAAPTQPATPASPVPAQRSEPQRVASASNTSSSRGAADPRVGCEDLFFVLAARCEASHCDQAAYTRHPRCTVVREQRRRDEARRNMTQ